MVILWSSSGFADAMLDRDPFRERSLVRKLHANAVGGVESDGAMLLGGRDDMAVEFSGGRRFIFVVGLITLGVSGESFGDVDLTLEDTAVKFNLRVVAFTLLACLDLLLVAKRFTARELSAGALSVGEWRRVVGVVGAFHE